MQRRIIAVIQADTEQNWHGHENGLVSESFPYEYPISYSMIEKAIPKLLELAKTYDIHYTFFVTGAMAKSNPSLLKAIKADGHEIGVHTHPNTHPTHFIGKNLNDTFADRLPIYSYSTQLQMIQEDLNALKKYGGVRPISFKAGCNSINIKTLYALDKLGFEIDASLWKHHFRHFWTRKKGIPTFFPSSILNINTSLLEVVGGIDERYLMNIKRFELATRTFLSRVRGNIVVLVISFHPMIMADPHKPSHKYLKNFSKILEFIKAQRWKILTLKQFHEKELGNEFGDKYNVKIDKLSQQFLVWGLKEKFFFHATRSESISKLLHKFYGLRERNE